MRVSVVVPTFRRGALLERSLAALTDQTLPAADYEVIVVDDARDAATRMLVERWNGRDGVRVRYLTTHPEVTGPAAARNVGWRNATSPVIAFTDDDTIPEPNWLRAGLEAMMPGVDAVHGRVRVPVSDPPTDYEKDIARLGSAGFVTANCFCRRDALRTVRGFDERFRTAWREDSDLYFKLLDVDCTVVYDPTVIVDHPVRPARWGEALRAERKHRYDALLKKLHPTRFEEHIGREAPPEYYAGVAAAAVTIVGVATRSRSVMTIGAIAWAFATGRIIRRRLAGTSRRPSHVAEVAATSTAIPFLSLYWRARGAVEFRTAFI